MQWIWVGTIWRFSYFHFAYSNLTWNVSFSVGFVKCPVVSKLLPSCKSRLLVTIAVKRWEPGLARAVIYAAVPHAAAASPVLCRPDWSQHRTRVLFFNTAQQRWPLQVLHYSTVLIIAPPWLSGFSAIGEADFLRPFHVNMTRPVLSGKGWGVWDVKKPQSRRLPGNTQSVLLASLKMLTHWRKNDPPEVRRVTPGLLAD